MSIRTDITVMFDGRILVRQGRDCIELVQPTETAAVAAALAEAQQLQTAMLANQPIPEGA